MALPFVVGIDLGTTNSCLAWTAGGSAIAIFPIEQLTPDGRAERAILPSVLYAAIADERAGIESGGVVFCDPPWVSGELARSRGEDVIGRTVTSAKSWLSHPSADPDAPSLPWGAAAGSPRLSAIDASARILLHLARAFEAKTRRSLSDAAVVLTLPASFDEGARASTLEAARRAGLRVTLLEEPQAAFYDYMAKQGALEALLGRKKDALVLVVDVGGGTTDLSLVAVQRRASAFACTRVATGDHLLLGGDNMDLALAAVVGARLPDPELDAFRMGQLVRQCRAAKEALLVEGAPDSFPIALAGRGARMVGAATTERITRTEVRRVLLEGFFPAVEPGRLPPQRRSGLVAAGLPYTRDAAITRHVARFLERYAEGRAPSAVLLNGGVFRSRALRLAVAAAIRGRTGARVTVLEESDPDLAVALGAARYGVARATGGARIEAGAARSYYVGVASPNEHRAVCVVPRGTLEGVRCDVRAPVLALRTGELARFELFRARSGVIHEVGQVIEPTEKSFAALPPLVTRVEGAAGHVDVVLSGELTPVGTLDLSLHEVDGKKRSFSLAFQVGERTRDAKALLPLGVGELPTPPRSEPSVERVTVTLSPRLRQAESVLTAAFSFPNKDGRAAQELGRELEKILGDRLGWNVLDARRLFDVLFERRNSRRWSPEHERVFWSLAGLCLRPGFGAPRDDRRMAELVTLFGQRLAFGDRAPVAQAFYIAWRRVAPGLPPAAQRAIFDAVIESFGDGHGSQQAPVAAAELRELLSWLERVDIQRKLTLGQWLVDESAPRPGPTWLADIARIGSRVPVYGGGAEVVSPKAIEAWLERLTELDWPRPSTVISLVRLARVTDDESRDVATKVRRRLAKELISHGATAEAVSPLKMHVPVSTFEHGASFGDVLPAGLSLAIIEK